MGARIERVVTSGTFNLDGGSWAVDNNVWLVGDDREVLVVDAAHDADANAICLYAPELGALFSGDTLFAGGPGATGRSYSDFPTIIGSIRDRLFSLPPETVVHTGHGDSTGIGAEAPHLDAWIARGY